MNQFEKIYDVVSFIPKGKISTYKEISRLTGIKNPRIVGFALHVNPDIKNIPCHRVVSVNGNLTGYAMGGVKAKEHILKKEGVLFSKDGKADINRSAYIFPKLLIFYFELLFKFDYPGKWPWFNVDKPHSKEEIAIGAILTQNTNWQNVQKAIENLRKQNAGSIEKIYNLKMDDLKQMIKPSGFYNQKAERLSLFCRFVTENYKSLQGLSDIPTNSLREKLLSLKGIGNETADTILLYALDKPVFVIDAYTKRFVERKNLTKSDNYDELKEFFETNLPRNLSSAKLLNLYQNYHALIVKWAKTYKSKSEAFI